MNRDTGTYVISTTLGEPVRAFVPRPLPPAGPALAPSVYVELNRQAELALARLAGVSGLVPSVDWLLYSATGILRFGSQNHGSNLAAGAEVASTIWHTVVALEPGCVLLEVKAGPFDSSQPKDLAIWAPEEGSAMAQSYLHGLAELAGKFTRSETAGEVPTGS